MESCPSVSQIIHLKETASSWKNMNYAQFLWASSRDRQLKYGAGVAGTMHAFEVSMYLKTAVDFSLHPTACHHASKDIFALFTECILQNPCCV